MARRTKEDALATRSSLLDAAERLFQARGVSRTSLQDIAEAAGVTRGAVYWHFKDKADLVDAMLERVVLPMEDGDGPAAAPPLQRLRTHVGQLFAHFACSEQVRRVFDILIHRIEYTQELASVHQRRSEMRRAYIERLRTMLAAAQRAGELPASPSARALSVGLFALVDGLIRLALLDPASVDLRRDGLPAVDRYLAGAQRG